MATKKHPYDQYCPDARAQDVAGDKWVLLIVRDLLDGPMRFVALQRRLPGISTEQLRTRLNTMVADGILTRTRYREVPPRVDYELTKKGRDLVPVIAAWAAWGLEHCADDPGADEADSDGSAAHRLADSLERGDRRRYGKVAPAVRWFANRGKREAVAA